MFLACCHCVASILSACAEHMQSIASKSAFFGNEDLRVFSLFNDVLSIQYIIKTLQSQSWKHYEL